MSKTLIDKIEMAMLSDAEDRTRQSEILQQFYDSQTARGKKLIDAVFICLCGWSLPNVDNNI